MRFLLSDLAATVGGTLVGPDREVDGVVTDSRAARPGQLFVPLIAARDGHDFIGAAVAGGATAHLSSIPADRLPSELDGVPRIEVADTMVALTAIGRLARSALGGSVIGITGSVGKTSVKDLTRAACAAGASTWASEASFNNEIGVPLTLANAPAGTDVAVIEMGARGIGHIAELCAVAAPTVGVVTRVALVHSELFGSIEAVARGKGELIEALPSDGTAVLNVDDPMVAAMAERTGARIIGYGFDPGADVRLSGVEVDDLLRPRFTVDSDWGRAEVTLAARGAHMAHNAVAGITAALAAGVGFDAAVTGVAEAELSRWRMEVERRSDGLVVINDAYNANPTSMRAALESLRTLDADRRVAVVGVMAELGDESAAEHRAVADEAVASGVEIIAVAAPEYGPAAEHVGEWTAACQRLGPLGPGDAVLVKGSRVAGLELLAKELLAGASSAGGPGRGAGSPGPGPA